VGGTTVITVLAHGDHPEWYGLPKDPHVPDGVRFWKNIARPLGALAIAGAFFSMVGHYLSFGPKKAEGRRGDTEGRETRMTRIAAVKQDGMGDAAMARARRAEDVVVGDEIVRERLSARVVHWTVALTFFICCSPGADLDALPRFLEACSAGCTSAACSTPGLESRRGCLDAHVRAMASQMLLTPADREFITPSGMLKYFQYQNEDADVGKYNGGQKCCSGGGAGRLGPPPLRHRNVAAAAGVQPVAPSGELHSVLVTGGQRLSRRACHDAAGGMGTPALGLGRTPDAVRHSKPRPCRASPRSVPAIRCRGRSRARRRDAVVHCADFRRPLAGRRISKA